MTINIIYHVIQTMLIICVVCLWVNILKRKWLFTYMPICFYILKVAISLIILRKQNIMNCTQHSTLKVPLWFVKWLIMRFIQFLRSFQRLKWSKPWWGSRSISANYSYSLVKKFIAPFIISDQKRHELQRSSVCNIINYQQKSFGQTLCFHPLWRYTRYTRI